MHKKPAIEVYVLCYVGCERGGSPAGHRSLSDHADSRSQTSHWREECSDSQRLQSGLCEGWAHLSHTSICHFFDFIDSTVWTVIYFLGILRLNKRFLSQSSDRHLLLLPKQTYLNVDEDAALTLERKRNYIYCLIVQIMKNEKEMHIDNLVFKVKSDRWKLTVLTYQGLATVLGWI